LASALSIDIHASQGVMEMQRSFTMWSETCRLPQLLEGNMPGYSLASTRYDEDARKIGCARRVVGEHCNHSWLSLNQPFFEGQASKVLPQLSQRERERPEFIGMLSEHVVNNLLTYECWTDC